MTARDQSDVLMPRRLYDHLRDLLLADEPTLQPATCGECAAIVQWAVDGATPAASREALQEVR